ncbi:apoptotic chromatin condensation inducer in the nucleus-like [Uloborus diversus]|uniref:apoptotic chromatin condensation inducer in the nucleus-like n=1 Tax=Uloborus diversus TaxID=327109 RepID=UPI00240948E5|nr:apoptotic chromatin condensation inducer in the nucleus-like [Uloborus diversus]
MNSEDSGNQSSSDSGEYKSDEETKVTKALTPTRDIKRQYSRSESSESSSSESSQSSTKQSSKVPAKKPKVDSLKKTSGDKVKCPAESGAKTVFGGQSSKDIINLAPRQKLKIKRDNIILEQHTSSKQESSTEKNVLLAETRSDASMDKNALSDIPSSHSKEPENEEEISKPYVSRKVTLSNRKLSRSSVDEKEDSTQKKSKWGSFATAQKNSQNISISTSSLKSWFPDFKLINEPAPANEIMPMEQSPTLSDEKIINQTSEREGGIPKQPPLTKDLSEQNMQSVMEEEPIEQGPVSNIIFIQNLVRPFTLLQLKDLLKQHGNFVEGEFWIDKIKSKCIVVYETEEAAVKAKNALNNTRWPPSNPKILTVQYISEEEIEFHKRGGEPPKPTAPPVEAVECYDVKAVSPVEEIKRKDREIRREREKSKPLREWDKDKIVQDSPEREHYMNKENEKIKPVEKKEKKESKRRPNDDTPAKLLDDLFQKTKSSPCIYWLPLTAEQIKEKAEERRIRRLEQEMRILKEQEVGDRKKIVRPGHRSRERELPRSSSRSRSPVSRRR